MTDNCHIRKWDICSSSTCRWVDMIWFIQFCLQLARAQKKICFMFFELVLNISLKFIQVNITSLFLYSLLSALNAIEKSKYWKYWEAISKLVENLCIFIIIIVKNRFKLGIHVSFQYSQYVLYVGSVLTKCQ